MAVRTFQSNENKPEIVKLLKDGLTREEIVKRFPISDRTVRRYEKEIEEEKARGGKTPNLSPSNVAKGAQELAVLTSKAPAPIVFRISDQNIDLKPGDLYDAFRYCEDIKRMDPSIDDDFSTMVKTACKHVWEVFSEREVRKLGVNVELVEEV